jgi:hypothetical protein
MADTFHPAASAVGDLQEQWRNPSDIFTILLLVGGDVLHSLSYVVDGLFRCRFLLAG